MKNLFEDIESVIFTEKNLKVSIEIIDVLLELLNEKEELDEYWKRFKNILPFDYKNSSFNGNSVDIIFLVYSSINYLYRFFEFQNSRKGLTLLEKLV